MSLNRATPSLALAAYAETWISGAKVIVFGDALSPLPQRLVERGARLVQVYDRDPARAAEAEALNRSRQISHAPLESAGSARDGVFDFGIVEDLGAGARNDDLPLGALKRALSRRGMALIAARNPEVHRSLIAPLTRAEEPLGYYELFELVSKHFEEVRMLGQTAFVGYAVADFAAAEDSDVRLDTAFLPGGAEEPEWFLALVSTLPVAAEAFSVIQLPLADVPPAPSANLEQIERLEQALEQAQARSAELERGKAARDGAKEAQKEAALHQQKEQQKLEALERQLEALQAELAKREHWLKGLESRAATADQRADDAQTELEQSAQRETAEAERRKQLERQLEEALRAKRALEDGQIAARRELEELKQGSGAHARNLSELERRALTLGTRVDELTAQLAAATRQGQELRSANQELRAATEQLRSTNQELSVANQALNLTNQELRSASDEESGTELAQLEAQLVERGKEVARVARELEQTERFGRQLIAQLEESKAARNGETPKRDIERLARRNAELEADLEAARWTISSLGAGVSAAVDGSNENARRSAD